jgi:hypothetical protein
MYLLYLTCDADDLDLPATPVQHTLPPYFKQKSNDPNIFSEDHGGIKVQGVHTVHVL